MRIEIDFISSMIEIPRSRPRNADRTKHGGEGEIDLTAQSGSAWEPPGMNLMLSSSSPSFSAFGGMFREIRLPHQWRTDGRTTGRCATAVAAVAEAALATRRLKPRKADD